MMIPNSSFYSWGNWVSEFPRAEVTAGKWPVRTQTTGTECLSTVPGIPWAKLRFVLINLGWWTFRWMPSSVFCCNKQGCNQQPCIYISLLLSKSADWINFWLWNFRIKGYEHLKFRHTVPNWKNFWINLQSFQVHGTGVTAPCLALGLTELALVMVTPHCQIRKLFTASPRPKLWRMDSCRHAFQHLFLGFPWGLFCAYFSCFLGIWNVFHGSFSYGNYRRPRVLGLTSFSSCSKCHPPTFSNVPAFSVSGLTSFSPPALIKGQWQQDGSPILTPLAQRNLSHGDLYSGKAESWRQQRNFRMSQS